MTFFHACGQRWSVAAALLLSPLGTAAETISFTLLPPQQQRICLTPAGFRAIAAAVAAETTTEHSDCRALRADEAAQEPLWTELQSYDLGFGTVAIVWLLPDASLRLVGMVSRPQVSL